ncbi:hypothetical protein, partial [Lacticaseibacillus rhamnosus]|uniref:hypothetical protein n=1 Tax=Lacticaseibacillus rhamnosus TaxID=47715 RepID=UPI001F4CE884
HYQEFVIIVALDLKIEECRSLKIMKLPLPSFLNMCMLSTIGREFIVHWATRPPYKLKLQHLRAKWPPDLMLSRVQISY